MTNPDYTHLALIVDRSGSMSPIARDMNGSIAALLKEQGALPGELHVDITTFDTEVQRPYIDARADDVKGEIIIPRGMTALNDAIGKTVVELGERFAALPEEDRPGKVIIAIVTDGGENSSRDWKLEAVRELVTKQQDEFAWEFLFMGANIDSFAAASGFGIGAANTINYAHDAAGSGAVMAAASGYVTRSRLAGDTTGFTEAEREEAI